MINFTSYFKPYVTPRLSSKIAKSNESLIASSVTDPEKTAVQLPVERQSLKSNIFEKLLLKVGLPFLAVGALGGIIDLGVRGADLMNFFHNLYRDHLDTVNKERKDQKDVEVNLIESWFDCFSVMYDLYQIKTKNKVISELLQGKNTNQWYTTLPDRQMIELELIQSIDAFNEQNRRYVDSVKELMINTTDFINASKSVKQEPEPFKAILDNRVKDLDAKLTSPDYISKSGLIQVGNEIQEIAGSLKDPNSEKPMIDSQRYTSISHILHQLTGNSVTQYRNYKLRSPSGRSMFSFPAYSNRTYIPPPIIIPLSQGFSSPYH
ncbi:MAG: hypothetical protein AAGI66_04360 [Cyanobacteria bacterium P01_H01_bin.74]